MEEITEYYDDANRWSTTVTGDNGETVTGNTASGTLGPGESQAVTFTNTYSTPTGTLTVEKVVKGDTAQADTQLFSFKLTWKHENSGTTASAEKALDEEGDVTSGDDTILFDEAGSYTFTLSGSQSRRFTIPEGVTWTVEETQALNANWTTTAARLGSP